MALKRRMVLGLALSIALWSLSSPVLATTWVPQDIVCPICKTTNTFQVVASYGSYIYNWPSKFQYIFWPLTDSAVLYSCKKCHLTCFMWDFEKIPADKHGDIQKRLEGLAVATEYEKYTQIPIAQRLRWAEAVYSALNKDDEFWCRFYRAMGYHFEEEKNTAAATEARKKALGRAEKMLTQAPNKDQDKELLLITGALRHFLKDDKGALADFQQAQTLKYQNKQMKKEQAENQDQYLTELLKEYVKKIQNPEKTSDPGKKN